MLKFFVGEYVHTVLYHEDGKQYESELPEFIHRISFCALEHARIFADKIRERNEECINAHTSRVTYHSSCIFPVDVPDNWSGDDVAMWLESTIEAGDDIERIS